MAGRKPIAASALAALFVAGCATAPQPAAKATRKATQDVEFVRGCWVLKESGGPRRMFLRLLPDGPDGPAYEGDLTGFDGARTIRGGRLSIQRDGSSLTLQIGSDPSRTYAYQAPDAQPPADWRGRRAIFGNLAGGGYEDAEVLVGGDLRQFWMIVAGRPVINMERDGCD